MGYIEVYLEVLRYKIGINPTIPNFIFFKTPLFQCFPNFEGTYMLVAHFITARQKLQ